MSFGARFHSPEGEQDLSCHLGMIPGSKSLFFLLSFFFKDLLLKVTVLLSAEHSYMCSAPQNLALNSLVSAVTALLNSCD